VLSDHDSVQRLVVCVRGNITTGGRGDVSLAVGWETQASVRDGRRGRGRRGRQEVKLYGRGHTYRHSHSHAAVIPIPIPTPTPSSTPTPTPTPTPFIPASCHDLLPTALPSPSESRRFRPVEARRRRYVFHLIWASVTQHPSVPVRPISVGRSARTRTRAARSRPGQGF
jgi:hypothetical protein